MEGEAGGMIAAYHPEPEQIMAIGRWLMSDEIKEALAAYMPKLGGPPAARQNRVADVAAALQIYGAVKAETDRVTEFPSDGPYWSRRAGS